MKALKAEDLRGWTETDLRSRISELEEERFRLQFRSATEPLEEPLRLRAIRRDVARLHTVLNQKTRAKDNGQKAPAKQQPAATRAAKKTSTKKKTVKGAAK